MSSPTGSGSATRTQSQWGEMRSQLRTSSLPCQTIPRRSGFVSGSMKQRVVPQIPPRQWNTRPMALPGTRSDQATTSTMPMDWELKGRTRQLICLPERTPTESIRRVHPTTLPLVQAMPRRPISASSPQGRSLLLLLTSSGIRSLVRSFRSLLARAMQCLRQQPQPPMKKSSKHAHSFDSSFRESMGG